MAIPNNEALGSAIVAAATCVGGAEVAPFAAAKAFALANRALTAGPALKLGGPGGEAEVISAWLADSVLAQKLNWPFALPLLGAALLARSARRRTGDAGEGDGPPAFWPPMRTRPRQNFAPRGRGRRCEPCSTTIA